MEKNFCDLGVAVLALIFAVAALVAVTSGNVILAAVFLSFSFVTSAVVGVMRYRRNGNRRGLVCAALSGLCCVTYLFCLRKRFK